MPKGVRFVRYEDGCVILEHHLSSLEAIPDANIDQIPHSQDAFDLLVGWIVSSV